MAPDSGLLGLASLGSTPLVLDEGAVVSLPVLAVPAPLLPPLLSNTPNGSGDGREDVGHDTLRSSPCIPAATADFVVGFPPESTAGIPGFPLPTEATSAEAAAMEPGEEGAGTAGAGAVRYAVLANQGDVDKVVAEALVGPDVAADASEAHGAAAVPEEGAGRAGGGSGVLGGVEQQVTGSGAKGKKYRKRAWMAVNDKIIRYFSRDRGGYL